LAWPQNLAVERCGQFICCREFSTAPPGLEIVLMLNPQLKLWAIIGRHSVAERAGASLKPFASLFLGCSNPVFVRVFGVVRG